MSKIENPFEAINARLDSLEALLLHIKNAQDAQLQPETNQFFNLDEAASFLKLRPIDVYGMVNRKELTRRLYFSKTELIDILKQSGGRIRIGAQKKII